MMSGRALLLSSTLVFNALTTGGRAAETPTPEPCFVTCFDLNCQILKGPTVSAATEVYGENRPWTDWFCRLGKGADRRKVSEALRALQDSGQCPSPANSRPGVCHIQSYYGKFTSHVISVVTDADSRVIDRRGTRERADLELKWLTDAGQCAAPSPADAAPTKDR